VPGSHNPPYKHFADEEELLAAVAARDLARRAVATRRATRNRTPADALRAMLHGYVRHAAGDPATPTPAISSTTSSATSAPADIDENSTVR
jgi:AcrR family transcriptional regulator